jgi:hypothetical protein
MRERERERLDAYILLSIHLFYYCGLLSLSFSFPSSLEQQQQRNNRRKEGTLGTTNKQISKKTTV